MIQLHFDRYSMHRNQFYLNSLSLESGEGTEFHCHDFYEFTVVIKGSYEETCNGRRVVLTRRQGHILLPQDVHQLTAIKSGELNILQNVEVKKDIFEMEASRLGLSPEKLCGYFRLDETAMDYYLRKLSQCKRQSPLDDSYNFLLCSMLDDILIERICGESLYDIPPAWFKDLCEEINIAENLSVGLEKLLELSGRSQSYINRCFRRYTGMTPTEYINERRVQYAAQKLETTDDTVIDIALSCGYETLAYFNRRFKAYYGVTPREYRQQNKYALWSK